jgi:UDP-sulfoquinovose synthase
MGEYGSPEGEIPEGKPSEFPRAPGSLYHATKVADSVNCELASDKWGLSITDIMQAIVYGTRWQRNGKSPDSPTRFDVDECFGTVINRFVAQVVSGQAMTIYGVGGQTRGFLPLSDSVKCIERLIDTPAAIGEYRVVNQLAEWMTISEVAIQVRESIGGEIEYIDNPRIENESHKYNVRTDTLNDLGYSGDRDMQGIIGEMHEDLSRGAKDLILKVDMKPTVKWR